MEAETRQIMISEFCCTTCNPMIVVHAVLNDTIVLCLINYCGD